MRKKRFLTFIFCVVFKEKNSRLRYLCCYLSCCRGDYHRNNNSLSVCEQFQMTFFFEFIYFPMPFFLRCFCVQNFLIVVVVVITDFPSSSSSFYSDQRNDLCVFCCYVLCRCFIHLLCSLNLCRLISMNEYECVIVHPRITSIDC